MPRAIKLADSTNHTQQQRNQQALQRGACRFTMLGGMGGRGRGCTKRKVPKLPIVMRKKDIVGSCPSFPTSINCVKISNAKCTSQKVPSPLLASAVNRDEKLPKLLVIMNQTKIRTSKHPYSDRIHTPAIVYVLYALVHQIQFESFIYILN